MRVISALFVFLLFTSAPALGADKASALAELRAVIAERLAVMPDVARHKWNNELPVEDLEREEIVLERTIEKAVEAGVDDKLAGRFISHQMMASKQVQASLFVVWRAAGRGKFDGVPDLQQTLRPQIVSLTDRLIDALKAAKPYLKNCGFLRDLQELDRKHLGKFVGVEAWAVATGFQYGEVECRTF